MSERKGLQPRGLTTHERPRSSAARVGGGPRVAAVALVMGSSLSGSLGAAELAHAHEPPRRCSPVSFSVALDPAQPATYELRGTLCQPRTGRARALQVLVHGASYNQQYWDFPFQPETYSYARRANDAGFATLAIDRLGSGESERPPPELVTVHASAYTLHQVVAAVRSGHHPDERGRPLRFDHIVLVGHSFGSNISWTEAALYGDVDGLVLTGISHDPAPPGAPLTELYAYPAMLDPAFAGLGLPPGYITTIVGFRDELFYHVPGADPDVIAVDEQTKDTLPVGMLFDQFTTYDLTAGIEVPVLNVIGDFDTLACQLPSCTESGSVEQEGQYFPAAESYTQLIVPDAGHSLNLHQGAPEWMDAAQSWIEEQLRPHPGCGPGH